MATGDDAGKKVGDYIIRKLRTAMEGNNLRIPEFYDGDLQSFLNDVARSLNYKGEISKGYAINILSYAVLVLAERVSNLEDGASTFDCNEKEDGANGK
jgi:hypothetical protein